MDENVNRDNNKKDEVFHFRNSIFNIISKFCEQYRGMNITDSKTKEYLDNIFEGIEFIGKSEVYKNMNDNTDTEAYKFQDNAIKNLGIDYSARRDNLLDQESSFRYNNNRLISKFCEQYNETIIEADDTTKKRLRSIIEGIMFSINAVEEFGMTGGNPFINKEKAELILKSINESNCLSKEAGKLRAKNQNHLSYEG